MEIKKFIPNTITILNLVMGVTIITFADNIKECKFILVSFFLALLFDFMDGYFARKLEVDSKIGLELDSLADIISFGVAPFVVLLQFYGDSIYNFLLFLPLVLAGCFRLARFNINPTTHSKKPYYQGLPIPSSAIIVPLIIFFELPVYIAIGIIIPLSLLMVSKVKIRKFG